MKNPPAFQFYPKDFISDFNVMMMSMEEVGMYITLLCFCWMEGEIPNDMCALAKLCRCQESDMANAWQTHISRCFTLSECGTFYYHNRLRAEREKQLANSKARSESGKKGANARHSLANAKDLLDVCQDFAEANDMANSSTPYSLLHVPHSSVEIHTPEPKPEPKPKVKKISYAEHVRMTEEEHSKLVNEYGEDDTQKFIERLNAYKGSTGKTYKSDYMTMFSWVIKAVKKDQQPNKPNGKPNGRTYSPNPAEYEQLARELGIAGPIAAPNDVSNATVCEVRSGGGSVD